MTTIEGAFPMERTSAPRPSATAQPTVTPGECAWRDSSSDWQKRWVPRRKAEVVAAVRGGLLTVDEAYERYRLTAEEFMAWQEAIDQFGLAGLRVSHTRL